MDASPEKEICQTYKKYESLEANCMFHAWTNINNSQIVETFTKRQISCHEEVMLANVCWEYLKLFFLVFYLIVGSSERFSWQSVSYFLYFSSEIELEMMDGLLAYYVRA